MTFLIKAGKTDQKQVTEAVKADKRRKSWWTDKQIEDWVKSDLKVQQEKVKAASA